MSTTGLRAYLRRLADLTEARGAQDEAAAWRQIAEALEGAGLRGDDETPLGDLTSTGASVLPPSHRQRLQTFLTQGPEHAIHAAGEALPWLFRRLLASSHIESQSIALLARHGIITITELDAAFRNGLGPVCGASQDAALRQAVEALAPDRPLVPLGRAADLLDSFVALASTTCPDLAQLTPAGDVRRFEPLVEWLAVVGSAADPMTALDALCALPAMRPVRHRTGGRAIVTWQQGEVDVRIAAPGDVGTVLLEATGAGAHLAAVRARQRVRRAWPREADEYGQAGLAWIPPEMRHDTGEVEAAASGALPALVTREHMRGDLHMHTVYSDGRDSVLDMVRTASTLGYAYVAITDHSARSFASRTLSLDRLARQREEIAALRERFPALVILHGVEVDIMPDGSLDFSDDVLEPLDIVLASLHDRAGHDDRQLTRRCLQAIHHPLVNIITHPANRMVGRDAGYALDFPAVFEAAVATGTALEIDGAPGHLDLEGALARAAVAAGVTVVIDSDCHHATLLDRQMRLGVGTARRGWVEPRHVLNTRPVGEVRAFIAAKRAGPPPAAEGKRPPLPPE